MTKTRKKSEKKLAKLKAKAKIEKIKIQVTKFERKKDS